MSRWVMTVVLAALLVACGPRELEPDPPCECDRCEDWNAPLAPFRIHGNTWYVGTDGLASLLVEAGDGLVLVDGGLPQSAALIDANIRALGFDPLDIRAILVSHAHFDHAGGIAALQRLTGATVYASERAQETLVSGRLVDGDPQFVAGSDSGSFPAIKKVVPVADGASVTVGSVRLTAIHTPGHTPGGVTWTWESCAMGACYDIVYADSLTAVSAPGFSFAASGAAESMIDSAGRIAELDCDILLSPHPFFFGLHDKLERRDGGNPFINDMACSFYAESALDWLKQRLDAER